MGDPTEDPTPVGAYSASGVSSSASAAATTGPATHPLVVLLNSAAHELNTFSGNGVVGEAASDPAIGGWVRAGVYKIIQAQTKEDEGAIYNDLKCPVCRELFNYCSMHAGREKEVITVACGHSACRGCFRGWTAQGHTDCPLCRTPGVLGGAALNARKSISISNIIDRLKPRTPGTAGGRRKRRSKKTIRRRK